MKIPRNPFTVAGTIRQCWLFVYRLPVAVAQPLLPAPLQLVTQRDFAFLNIVVCRLSGMRPALLPASTGLGYWHVAYRLYARARRTSGPMLEGLHFLRSDCDRSLVQWGGNLFTGFNFHRAGINVVDDGVSVRGQIESPDAAAKFRIDRSQPPALPAGSPFASLEDAAWFLKYKPYALSVETADSLQVVRVRREESVWRSELMHVPEADWQFLAGRQATLELCYEVEPIDYLWERAQSVRVEKCQEPRFGSQVIPSSRAK